MLYVLSFLSMCFGLALGYLLLRHRRAGLATVLAVGMGLAWIVVMVTGFVMPGFDGLVFLGLGVFVLAPALGAMGGGVVLALWSAGATHVA